MTTSRNSAVSGAPICRFMELDALDRAGPAARASVVVADVGIVELLMLAQERCQEPIQGRTIRDRASFDRREPL